MKWSDRVTVEVKRREDETRKHGNGEEYQVTRWVPDGERTGIVEIEIDVAGLFASLGRRALKSVGGRAQGMSGLVKAKVRRKTVLETRTTPPAGSA